MAEGGTALEAAVAMAASLSVVYPHMTGLGGDGFWLVAVPGETPVGIQACGPAAILAKENIRKVDVVEFAELGMEAIWQIEVEDFPAFILVDDKGNDFFESVGPGCAH